MDYGIIVDVETTGLDPRSSKIIEIGVLEFGMGETFKPAILSMYGALQDPGELLTQEISNLTGLTDDMLRGQEINWDYVATLWMRAQVVIAHNAAFDRSFLSRVPSLSGIDKHWACSVKHIDWAAKGFGSRKLQYLAADHGFVNPFAHRALFDCATTFRVVAEHMNELMQRSYEPEYRILAVGSPFETKDLLKSRNYRWDPQLRVWHRTVLKDQLEAERMFLQEFIYRGPSMHQEETLWFNNRNGTEANIPAINEGAGIDY